MTSEFDTYTTSYEVLHDKNLALVGAESSDFLRAKLNWCRQLAGKHFTLTSVAKLFLDFGCGTGRFGHEFHRYFDLSWNYVGVDQSSACIEEAKQRSALKRTESSLKSDPLYLSLESWNESAAKYDFILAACVFHHIEASHRRVVLNKLWNLLKPTGVILIWEHNPWNPLTRRIVNDCAFDKNASLLSISDMNCLWRETTKEGTTHFRFVTFFPGLLRSLQRVEPLLGWLPLGGQWVFWAKKESAPPSNEGFSMR